VTISLTKEQMLERFVGQKEQFSEALGKRIKPQLPLTINSYDDLAINCTQVVMAFLEVVFVEDTK